MRNLVTFLTLTLLPSALMLPVGAQNLVSDPGFETPVVGPGGFQTGFQTFTVGQVIGGVWTVVGSSANNVAVYPNTETVCNAPNTAALNVQQGSQAIDLTGNLDNGAATGISQSFATTPGAQYSLSFYLGQIDSETPTSVLVQLNGNTFQTATNSLPTATICTTAWQQFAYTFIASGSTTTLSFINASPNGVALTGIDNVSVTLTGGAPTPPATPAPSGLILSILGLVSVGLYLGRRTFLGAAR